MTSSSLHVEKTPVSRGARAKRTAVFILALIPGMLFFPRAAAGGDTAPAEMELSPDPFVARVFAVPDCFIENRGQWTEPKVHFLLCREGMQLLATREGPVMRLMRRRGRIQAAHRLPSSLEIHAVSWRFPGGRMSEPRGARPTGAVYHSHVGPPWLHRSDIPVYQEVRYPRIYPGIDLVLRAEADRVVFAWIVSPGADWRAIRMQCPLAAPPTLHQRRFLLIPLAPGLFLDQSLRAYQPDRGGRRDIGVEFQLFDNNEYGFLPLGSHVSWLPMVFTLDLAWSTAFGPGRGRAAIHTHTDSDGRILATGWKLGSWFPAGREASDDAGAANPNLFLAAFRRDGTPLWFSEWGGSGGEYVRAMLTAADGIAFVAGATDSRNLFSNPAHRRPLSYRGGVWDAFAAAFSARGHLLWAATLGGREGDMAAHLDRISTDTLLLVGPTDSLDFPVTEPWEVAETITPPDAFAALFNTRGELLRSILFPAADARRVRDYLVTSTLPIAPTAPLRPLLFVYDLETGPGLYRDW